MATFTPPPVLPATEARAVLHTTQSDPLLYAGVALLLLAGQRPKEVQTRLVRDYSPGDSPTLRTGTDRHERTIRIAPTAAAALDAYLAAQATEPEEPLLLGLQNDSAFVRLVRQAASSAGVSAGVHDLRKAAIAAALDAGVPLSGVQAYFGFRVTGWSDLLVVPERYDVQIAAVLERAFA